MIPLSDGLSARRFPARQCRTDRRQPGRVALVRAARFQRGGPALLVLPVRVENACHVSTPWILTWATAIFLHASGDHILGNMLFLAVFGKNVEDTFGHLRFLAFHFAGGMAATLTQNGVTLLLGSPSDEQAPNLGARTACQPTFTASPRG